ncbi:hypothetical protein HKBW3S44_00905 [Candidatus Hakubella thermalkaliphila]|uniref:Uncharacterized protein n=1 Tax=Candidatus Hakubella thermalkaliphila TaxID=2754717 RepID=A0A6V8NW14_9ACTN|nr:hypothetical protein [Candidatus Hakubella thermalkaliphila]GFP23660.1 hypothetical protein HKBW3S09_01125 [Candidatus Hakubella thermalkaliphila]GFP25032.1 hypothetical protein HKBW3S25_00482 [Candidatus Hakubella thermalkaliphila]GFP37225.1 hypothetical protein HKBW3S44_00905 [Candidatus Hakubella thermalkaliphila]
MESAASWGKIKDFPPACLENSFGVSPTSHNLYDKFEFNPGKNRKFIDLNLPLLYHGEEEYEWFAKW